MYFKNWKAEDYLSALKQDIFNIHGQTLEAVIAKVLELGLDRKNQIDQITKNMHMPLFPHTKAYLEQSCGAEAKRAFMDLNDCHWRLIKMALALAISHFKEKNNPQAQITADDLQYLKRDKEASPLQGRSHFLPPPQPHATTEKIITQFARTTTTNKL